MQTIKIKNEQCFLDLVLESTGTINNTLVMAQANDTSITDEKTIGSIYKVTGNINKSIGGVLNIYIPATGLISYKNVFNYRLPHILPMF
ncbi:hypothetical protein M2306_002054 [Myroides gitamensis]|uniref:hypothetical protein n=1 Tax=Myroides odoratus TaxID=256 RepID=UPI0021694A2F|nr:hypothetical protein [Myroides odoratus]MCS4239513.1 hypothetical protein [Myroides odoratus]MDH6601360.1 hypothetical protein [Myroides gitamensis]